MWTRPNIQTETLPHIRLTPTSNYVGRLLPAVLRRSRGAAVETFGPGVGVVGVNRISMVAASDPISQRPQGSRRGAAPASDGEVALARRGTTHSGQRCEVAGAVAEGLVGKMASIFGTAIGGC